MKMNYMLRLVSIVALAIGIASCATPPTPKPVMCGDVDPGWIYQRTISPWTGQWTGQTDYWDCRQWVSPDDHRCKYVGRFRTPFWSEDL